jgi:S-adenosylmethionine decarboxylase proenzyme
MNLGKILIVEGYMENGKESILNDLYAILQILQKIVQECGLTILKVSHHQFQPQGLTVLFLLSESHVSIHTWPEHGRFSMDVYSCRDDYSEEKILDILRQELTLQKLQHQVLSRTI